MEQQYQNISISKLKQFFNTDAIYGMGDDFFVAETHDDAINQIKNIPIQTNDLIISLCRKGELKVESRDRSYVVKAPAVMVNYVGEVISLSGPEGSRPTDIDCAFIAISREYIFDLKIDISKILGKLQVTQYSPYLSLQEKEFPIVESYFKLLHDLFFSGLSSSSKRECITGVLSSMLNMAICLVASRLPETPIDYKEIGSSRSKAVLIDFIRLVSDYHEQERDVKFYADKLCLTPKYLSKLVKEASGHPASEIIDGVVIAKAKNLLRYTDTAIKAIVAQLNFPDQSSFNKFFKAKTGITPLKYRNS